MQLGHAMKPSTITLDKSLLKRFQPLDTLSDNHLKEICSHAYLETAATGKMLFKRNQTLDTYHYLVSGAVDLLNAKYQATHINATSLEARQPLVNSNPSPVSAVAASPSQFLAINKEFLDLVLTWDQAGNYLVKELGQETEETQQDWMSGLLGSTLFQKIPPTNLQQLFIKFKEIPAHAGQTIIQQGDTGASFFVLKRGAAEVRRADEHQKVQVLAQLSPGQYFGEEALIGSTVRNASVVMTQPGTLMELGKEDFKKLLEEPVVQYISYQDLESLRHQSQAVTLVDVRLPVEIPPEEQVDRLVIPLAELRARLATLDPQGYYVLCPDGGHRAIIGSYLLNEAGFKAVNLQAPQ